jgi:glycosyltransferase involved in cell wall biosynthesis
MKKILSVATAAVLKEQIADVKHLNYPRVDYIELQNLTGAETVDYSAYEKGSAGKNIRYLETQLRSDLYLAAVGWFQGREYPQMFAWSERAGIPLAAYRRLLGSGNRFVSMFQCWSKRQEMAVTKLDLFSQMDDIVVHCSSMKRKFIDLGVPEEKIKIIHYSIDQCFFMPAAGYAAPTSQIMSIGETRSRDYPSLFKAVDRLPVELVVPAYGHWYAREKRTLVEAEIPQNVSLIKHVPQSKLRDLYASSQFVVLPIHDVVFSAGATATLEAGSMARPVIAFRSEGITDYIIDGETGILVKPGDVRELRSAIEYLLANPSEVQRMGANARQRIVESLNLETYVAKIANLLQNN